MRSQHFSKASAKSYGSAALPDPFQYIIVGMYEHSHINAQRRHNIAIDGSQNIKDYVEAIARIDKDSSDELEDLRRDQRQTEVAHRFEDVAQSLRWLPGPAMLVKVVDLDGLSLNFRFIKSRRELRDSVLDVFVQLETIDGEVGSGAVAYTDSFQSAELAWSNVEWPKVVHEILQGEHLLDISDL